MILIESALNGAVLTTIDEDTGRKLSTIAYEFSTWENLQSLQTLLYDLCDMLGANLSRHDKYAIRVHVVHGDKYECKDEGCPICQPKETKEFAFAESEVVE